MKEIFRNVFAALAGAFTGIVLMMISQMIAGRLYPLPEGVDRADEAAMAEFIRTLPAAALLIVLAGYFAGTLAAAWVAGRLSLRSPVRQAVMVGGLFLVASLINLNAFPHPAWFWAGNLGGVVAASWLAIRLLPAEKPAA